MTDRNNKQNMLKAPLFFILLLLLAPLFQGCLSWPFKTNKAEYKPISEQFKQPAGGLIKKIHVMPFTGSTGPEEKNYHDIFQRAFLSELSAFAILDTPAVSQPLPRYANGDVNNFELSKEGREKGLNIILTGGSVTVTVVEELRGKLLLRKPHYYIQVLILADNYSTVDATKILKGSYLHEVEIKAPEYQQIKEKNPESMQKVEAVVTQAGHAYAQYYKAHLDHTPWAGFVRSNAGNVTLSAGEKSGLEPGMELAVYGIGSEIEGYNGHKFLTPGIKTGEIRITSVSPESAQTEVISGTIATDSIITTQ